MTADSPEEAPTGKRQGQGDGQLVPSKVLGGPTVFVEALDAEGAVVVEKIESEVALLWPFVQKEVVLNKRGKTPETPVQLPKQVGQDILALLLEYCRYHRFPGRSDKERKLFDEKFIRLDTRRLCELTSAADSLDMKPLVDLSSRALARMIEGKSPEEIRETFHLPDDLTEEEKLEPVRNLADDPRIRLLNRLYAKKRKELADKKAELLRKENGHQDPAPVHQDTRSVEELLSFIEEEERQKQNKGRPKKRKPKKKREESREPGGISGLERKSADRDASATSSPGWTQGLREDYSRLEDAALRHGHLNGDTGLDDAEMDSEIEAFKRSLSADWEDRRAELILMAGAYQSRPTRVTTLTSLSNFRARPRDSQVAEDPGQESPSWQSIAAEAPLTPSAESSSRLLLAQGGDPLPLDSSRAKACSEMEAGESDLKAEPEASGASFENLPHPKLTSIAAGDQEAGTSEPDPNRLQKTEAVEDRQTQSSVMGHRKAVPVRATPESSPNHNRRNLNKAVLEPQSPLLNSDSAPQALVMLLQSFVDKLGFAGCIKVTADSKAPHLLAVPKSDSCLVEGLVPGLGCLRLEQTQEGTKCGQEHS